MVTVAPHDDVARQEQAAADHSGYTLIQAVPGTDPSDPALKATVAELRDHLPARAMVGGAAVENLDLQAALDTRTPLVCVILTLGFALLMLAPQEPLVALLGTTTNLLATAGLLGCTPQGSLDGWVPVFFFTSALPERRRPPGRRSRAEPGWGGGLGGDQRKWRETLGAAERPARPGLGVPVGARGNEKSPDERSHRGIFAVQQLWPGPGSNRRPPAFQAGARTN
ncbi:hypothetical protein GCM10009760_21630 [Kitasatospora kazusensis]|uniref:Membrane transport protein MMPL domain-containing protein n=1 Tax=Kitasatospora kazusensis TaxID=407974 RepID=A0ABN2ZAR8_9ACTN